MKRDDAANKANYAVFKKSLEESRAAIWKSAQWLSRKGFGVQVNPLVCTPDYEQRMKYTDNGDLQILQRIEAKGLSVNFTCREDWPFGENFIVCAKHAFDNATPKPHAFLIWNAALTHLAVVKGSTRDRWRVEKRIDRRYAQVEQEFLLAPLDCVTFHSGDEGNG